MLLLKSNLGDYLWKYLPFARGCQSTKSTSYSVPYNFDQAANDGIRSFDNAKESLTLDKECMVAEGIFWIHRISEAMSECLHWLDWGDKKVLQNTS